MCCVSRSSGSGSSGARGRAAQTKDKGRQSGEDSDASPPRSKKRKAKGKEPSATYAAREEMESLLAALSPKKPSKEQENSALQSAKIAGGPNGTERQKELEEMRKEAEAAQKIVDDQKEKARLEEENKKLSAQLEKEKSKKVPDPVAESPRKKSPHQK
jgi:hypothetical protein